MDRERRRRLRVPVRIDVRILVREELIQLQTLNISMKGVLCTSHPLLQKDDPCTVIIALNEESQISIDAKIVRAGQKETAITFVSMGDESFVHLKKMLQYNSGDAERIDEELRHPAF